MAAIAAARMRCSLTAHAPQAMAPPQAAQVQLHYYSRVGRGCQGLLGQSDDKKVGNARWACPLGLFIGYFFGIRIQPKQKMNRSQLRKVAVVVLPGSVQFQGRPGRPRVGILQGEI